MSTVHYIFVHNSLCHIELNILMLYVFCYNHLGINLRIKNTEYNKKHNIVNH